MRTRKFKFLIVYFLSLAVSLQVKSQSVSPALELDTNTIMVGQQVIAKLRLTHPSDLSIPWLALPDTLNGIELIAKGKIDTLATADKSKLTREQKFTITAFDSGFFVLTPFVFNYKKKGDTTTFSAETAALLLTVNLVPVDTAKAIHDIKGPLEIGITWQEIATYCFLGLLLIALTWLVVRLAKRKKSQPQIEEPAAPKRPAHEIAIEELEKLKEEKLWQQGNYKLYYTKLTDTLRTYISSRWNFDAMEKTTDEIMRSAFSQQLSSDNFSRIKSTLSISDLAKFAKYTPLATENEQSLTDAFIFVNDTRQSDSPTLPNTNNPSSQNQTHSQQP